MSSLDITHHERERDPSNRAWDDHNPPSLDLIRDCVHCGFCLPTCPSYAVFEEEMDSPRGRILLMRVGHEEGEQIWPDAGPGRVVMERLKSRFDPARIFRPGAFVGGI